MSIKDRMELSELRIKNKNLQRQNENLKSLIEIMNNHRKEVELINENHE